MIPIFHYHYHALKRGLGRSQRNESLDLWALGKGGLSPPSSDQINTRNHKLCVWTRLYPMLVKFWEIFHFVLWMEYCNTSLPIINFHHWVGRASDFPHGHCDHWLTHDVVMWVIEPLSLYTDYEQLMEMRGSPTKHVNRITWVSK